MENILKQDLALDFIFGGNSIFTCRNTKTGNRFTFKVTKHKKEEVYFVTEGKGIMVIDEEEFEIQKGDVVYVPFGKFHRTINSSPLPLSYIWITVEKEK